MAEVTVNELAKTVGASVGRLLLQMKEAGLSHSSGDASVSDEEKQVLLGYLKSLHGDKSGEPKKIILRRKTMSTVKSGNKKTNTCLIDEEYIRSFSKPCNNLEEVAKAHKIKHLVHFTYAGNLGSILQYGLLPRKTLLQKGYSFKHIDGYRFDGRPEASCVSISFPNWKLFYTARNKFKDINFNDWVVIEIDPLALLSTKVAFTRENAASYPQRNIPLEELTGKEALENLFTNEPNMKPREAIKLPIQFPTNPQSEVLFFGKIDTKFFQSVSFLGKDVANRYNIDGLSEEYTNIDFRIDGTYFKSRCDYKYWQKPSLMEI